MADGLCGPSNALQDAQKHASADRSLQQDRLTSRQPQAQGFRSQNPRDGMLDAEFAAFESSLAAPVLPDLQHPAHFGAPIQHASMTRPPMNPNTDWASDFQNLNISQPPPPQNHASSAAATQSGWQNEFLLMHQPHAQLNHLQAEPATHRGAQPTFAQHYPMHNAPMITRQVPQQVQTEQSAPQQQFDEAAFEAAFEQARADLEFQTTQQTQAEPEPEQDHDRAGPIESAHAQIRIGSDTIPPTDNSQGQDHADALAQVAGQLVDRLEQDPSDKFQQSSFLALMRRVRDREVRVEGDDFREVGSSQPSQSLHPGGPFYPGQPQNPRAGPGTAKDTPEPHQSHASSLFDEESPRLGTNPFIPGVGSVLYEG